MSPRVGAECTCTLRKAHKLKVFVAFTYLFKYYGKLKAKLCLVTTPDSYYIDFSRAFGRVNAIYLIDFCTNLQVVAAFHK